MIRHTLLIGTGLLLALPLRAQRVEPAVEFGVVAPLAGALVVPIPTPGQVGFTSRPRTYDESPGLALGGSARLRLTDTWGVMTGLAASLAQRKSNDPGINSCTTCSNHLFSGLLGLSARRELSYRSWLDVMLGGELIQLAGEANTDGIGVGTTGDVVPVSRTTGGLVASIATLLDFPGGQRMRLELRLRRYAVDYEWTDPTLDATLGPPESTPFTDLRLLVGVSPRRRQ